jgi:two-component system response regulator AtoC
MVRSGIVTSGITNGAPDSVRVLLLGPDDDDRRALHLLLDRRGLHVVAAPDLDSARRHFASAECDVVIADGAVAIDACKERAAPPVVAIVDAPELGLTLLDAGVDDVLVAPVDDLAIALAIRRVLHRRAPEPAPEVEPEPEPVLDLSSTLVGDGEAMQKLRATILLVAPTRATVLVLGESGTGKELVARAIHDASPRRAARFVAVNCAAIPGTLLESELFGHVRGAFTDAVRDKPGLFEDADGGTLFLDEVGEMPLALQAKLLRALQDGEIRRVGDTTSIKVDVRLVAATLRELVEDVAVGRFREDLYYRLNVLAVRIPPLRERAEDIPQLARFFVRRHGARHRRDVALADVAIDALRRQPWPGNVRELENVIERALVLSDGPAIDAKFLDTVMTVRTAAVNGGVDGLSIKKATRTLEEDLIRRALGVTQGNRTNAAKLLEISHRALLYKMKEYGIS